MRMKTEKTKMIMKYFDVTCKVAKQYEIILMDKQIRSIRAWYETKKGDGTKCVESEEVLRQTLSKEQRLRKELDKKVFDNTVIIFTYEDKRGGK